MREYEAQWPEGYDGEVEVVAAGPVPTEAPEGAEGVEVW